MAKHIQVEKKAIKAKERAETTYIKVVNTSAGVTRSGTGRIKLLRLSSYYNKL